MTYTLTVGETDVSGAALVRRGRVRWSRGVDVSRLLAPRAGSLEAVLDNADLAYNDDGTPLKKGQAVTLLGPSSSALFAGVLEKPTHGGEEWSELLGLPATSTLGRIAAAQRVSTAVLVAPRIDECIAALALACGVAVELHDLDVAVNSLNYWCLDEREHPMTALVTLVRSEGPLAMVFDGDGGELCFRNRDWLTTDARSIAVQGTYGYQVAA